MQEREEIIQFCLTLEGVYEDYPFHDPGWCVIRHRENKKIFACIFNREDHVWVNVKCDPEWRDFWRSTFASVQPAYHLNKKHWNSIILDGSVPDRDIKRMVMESYDLTVKVKEAGHNKADNITPNKTTSNKAISNKTASNKTTSSKTTSNKAT